MCSEGVMATTFQHLGPFSDWVGAARERRALLPLAAPGDETRSRVWEVLGFGGGTEQPHDVRTGARWERDGVRGEAISWSVGYGPRTEAWVLKPVDAPARLPGVIALHDHGGFKFYGKEKIAAGSSDPPPVLAAYHDRYYGGRAYANALARAGFVVLIHDTFLWGSRRFPLEAMPEPTRALVAASRSLWAPPDGMPEEVAEYNAAAGHHEQVVEKYCALLGTTLAGMVSYEDRVALNYLRSRPDILPDHLGCVGLSGGGNRGALLLATHDGLAAAVIVGLMSTYDQLLDHNVATHTWMFFPHGWARHGDWPDLAASRAPLPLLVQYDRDDALFIPEGMQAAHERLAAHYASVGAPAAYTGEFYPGPHKFDLEMQEAAFAWLMRQLGAGVAP
jgi:dienelactone hydrolase